MPQPTTVPCALIICSTYSKTGGDFLNVPGLEKQRRMNEIKKNSGETFRNNRIQ
jgi:hypothetical protein